MNSYILFILTICAVSSQYTREQLRGLYQHNLNKLLDEEIQQIVERVIRIAGIENKTTCTYPYRLNDFGFQSSNILSKFDDNVIIDRLTNILIDSNITISEINCCTQSCKHVVSMCKFIVINW